MRNATNPIPYETVILNVVKELRKDNFLLKDDMKDHDLLFCLCYPSTHIAEWDPATLMTGTLNIYKLPLIHANHQTRNRSHTLHHLLPNCSRAPSKTSRSALSRG